MNRIILIKFVIDLRNIKLIYTPIGTYLKKSFPKYYAKKLPYNTQINIKGESAVITISKTFYKKNLLYRFGPIIEDINE